MNYPVFAWKNLWRNRRRTLITIASVFFGVVVTLAEMDATDA